MTRSDIEHRHLPAHLIGTDFRESYDITCPACQKTLRAAPSILMTGFGINQGNGHCPGCRALFHLCIGDDGEMYSSLNCIDLDCETTEGDGA